MQPVDIQLLISRRSWTYISICQSPAMLLFHFLIHNSHFPFVTAPCRVVSAVVTGCPMRKSLTDNKCYGVTAPDPWTPRPGGWYGGCPNPNPNQCGTFPQFCATIQFGPFRSVSTCFDQKINPRTCGNRKSRKMSFCPFSIATCCQPIHSIHDGRKRCYGFYVRITHGVWGRVLISIPTDAKRTCIHGSINLYDWRRQHVSWRMQTLEQNAH